MWADHTHSQGCFRGPWLFLGDFNAVMGANEKWGRRPPTSASCLDFVHWTAVNLLSHLHIAGPLYIWHNGRFGVENVALHLDMSVCNEEWLNFLRHTVVVPLFATSQIIIRFF